MRRPVIGICMLLEPTEWRGSAEWAVLVPTAYTDAVTAAGGAVALLPPDPALVDEPDEVLDLLDGLLLAGGADMDPSTYGAKAHPATVHTRPERDAFELALARRAIEIDLPLLGICRGMQVMNVALGGTLHQHLPDRLRHEEHRRAEGTYVGVDHRVRLAAGSLAERAAGGSPTVAISLHHQGVDRIADAFRVTGWAEMDDWPEAIEAPANRFALGVQWHAEGDPESRVIAALVEAARQPVLSAPSR
jgi:putative glutamine amidotransferase